MFFLTVIKRGIILKGKLVYIIGAIVGLFIFIGYVFFNFPLDTGSATFHGSDNKIIVIPLGNKGITKIKDIDVVINEISNPDEAKIQIIHHPKGAFSLSFDVVEKNEFIELEGFNLPTGSGIQKRLASDNNTLAYGLTVRSDVPIRNVTIKYRYLGIHYSEDIFF